MSYGGKVAVDGIDLDTDHGECFACSAPNGAGKTTTVETHPHWSAHGRDRDPAAWSAALPAIIRVRAYPLS
jgi:ABC-type dipeptide/oligopeptide/nickel transport system ATPase subunit